MKATSTGSTTEDAKKKEPTTSTGFLILPIGDSTYGNLTPQEEKTFNEFKTMILAKQNEWKYSIAQFDDYDHLRFLRARKFDIKKTFEMFEKYVKWRIENKVDQIFTYRFPEVLNVKEIYPHGLHKTDKYGRPFYIERIGVLSVDELFKRTTKERIIQYYIREYEKLRLIVHTSCSIAAGQKIEKGCTVLDMLGGGSSLLTPKVYGFVKIATSICQDYFPEMLGIMFIVNTSWLLQTGWMIIKPFMDSKTREKIHILGSSYQKDLLEFVPAENLPTFLGGKCECKPLGCLRECPGPWKTTFDQFPKEDDAHNTFVPQFPAKWIVSGPIGKPLVPKEAKKK